MKEIIQIITKFLFNLFVGFFTLLISLIITIALFCFSIVSLPFNQGLSYWFFNWGKNMFPKMLKFLKGGYNEN